MLKIPLENHTGGGQVRSVRVEHYEGNVNVEIELDDDEARDGKVGIVLSRILETHEARALAAALVHYAGELEARR